MEIKVKNYLLKNPNSEQSENELVFIYPALQEFKKIKTPTKVAYSIVKTIGIVEKAIKEYEKTRIAICESLCEKDEKEKPIIEKNAYKFTEENKAEFNLKLNELLNTEITLDIFRINQSDIDNLKEINIACYETLINNGFINDDINKPDSPTV